MTDLDQLLARVDQVLANCDATQLPPLDHAPLVDGQALVEASPTRLTRLVRWVLRGAAR